MSTVSHYIGELGMDVVLLVLTDKDHARAMLQACGETVRCFRYIGVWVKTEG